MVFAQNFGDVGGTYEGCLLLSEVVGTPYHYLAEMNSFNLFALTGGGERKT